jgi:lauroyl/myristoyl acyltransferase
MAVKALPHLFPRQLLRRRSKELFAQLAYYGYRFSEKVVNMMPRWVAYLCAVAIADTIYMLVPGKFAALRENLRHVVPHAGEKEIRRIARRNIRNLARSWVDVMEMRNRQQSLIDRLDYVDADQLFECVARGQGVVVASMHFGCWETGLAAWNVLGNRMALLAEVLRPPQLFERILGARENLGVKIIPLDTQLMRTANAETARRVGASAMREVMRFLRSGGVVAMAMDRDLIGNGQPVQFFGTPAPLPIGVVDVAIRSRAAIIPIVLERRGRRVGGRVWPEIPYDINKPHQEEVQRVAREIVAIFEQVIIEHPDQWHVLDPIWDKVA